MKLNEFHVRDGRACAIGHRHTVAGRDVRIGGVEINLAATTRGQQNYTRCKSLDLAGSSIQHVNTHTTVHVARASGLPFFFRDNRSGTCVRVPNICRHRLDGRDAAPALFQLLRGNQIDGDMIFKDLDARPLSDGREQRALNFPAGDILGVQDATLRVSPFPTQIQLTRAVRPRDFPLGKFHAQFDQFGDSLRSFPDNRAHHFFFAQTGARLKRVAHVQLERVLFRRDRRDAALSVIGVRLGAVFLRDNGHAPVRRDFQREGQARDAAAEDEKIKLLHSSIYPCAIR